MYTDVHVVISRLAGHCQQCKHGLTWPTLCFSVCDFGAYGHVPPVGLSACYRSLFEVVYLSPLQRPHNTFRARYMRRLIFIGLRNAISTVVGNS